MDWFCKYKDKLGERYSTFYCLFEIAHKEKLSKILEKFVTENQILSSTIERGEWSRCYSIYYVDHKMGWKEKTWFMLCTRMTCPKPHSLSLNKNTDKNTWLSEVDELRTNMTQQLETAKAEMMPCYQPFRRWLKVLLMIILLQQP